MKFKSLLVAILTAISLNAFAADSGELVQSLEFKVVVKKNLGGDVAYKAQLSDGKLKLFDDYNGIDALDIAEDIYYGEELPAIEGVLKNKGKDTFNHQNLMTSMEKELEKAVREGLMSFVQKRGHSRLNLNYSLDYINLIQVQPSYEHTIKCVNKRNACAIPLNAEIVLKVK